MNDQEKRKLYIKLEGDSLDAICEVLGGGKEFADYNRGKSQMRQWFLGRLRDALGCPSDKVEALGD